VHKLAAFRNAPNYNMFGFKKTHEKHDMAFPLTEIALSGCERFSLGMYFRGYVKSEISEVGFASHTISAFTCDLGIKFRLVISGHTCLISFHPESSSGAGAKLPRRS